MQKHRPFHSQHKSISISRKSKRNDRIDTVIKITAPILTFLGLIIGIGEFNLQQSNNNKLEFKRRMWDKRFEAYSSLSDIISSIIIEKDTKSLDSLSRNFEKLYWGKLPLFSDPIVLSALSDFRNALRDKLNNIIDVNNPDILTLAGSNAIRQTERALNNARDELDKN
jgi:hypothetical protein